MEEFIESLRMEEQALVVASLTYLQQVETVHGSHSQRILVMDSWNYE